MTSKVRGIFRPTQTYDHMHIHIQTKQVNIVLESNQTDQQRRRSGVEVEEIKTHIHTRVVVSQMGHVVVMYHEALPPWVCPSQNRVKVKGGFI